jgi:hypothetical protein
MASKAQIKARENFVKNYAGKKKGSKSTKSNRKKDKKMAKSGNKTDIRLRKLKAKKGKK